jgi:opacity protein-like surface antigen
MAAAFLLAAPTAVPAGEKANGFYVRGSLGYDWSRSAALRDRSCNPAPLLIYFGCQAGGDGRRIGAYGDFGGSPAVELGFGARLPPAFRAELAFSHRPSFDFSANSNFLAAGRRQAVSAEVLQGGGMTRAFLDLAPLFGIDLGRFEPFFGTGLGVSYNRIGRVTYTFPELAADPATTTTRGGSRWNFAWDLSLGTGIRIGRGSVAEIFYRYSDFGRIEARDGPIEVVRGANRFRVENVAGTRARLRSNGIYLGFRQEF